ncbi:MAG: mannosyltransferase [Flaviaesturariibacter sp.]|nr:mannosyltransferase [Flaviaesturariibacter sp.]
MDTLTNRLPDKKRFAGSHSGMALSMANNPLAEILFISSYPPRECGIATYSHDLIEALENGFNGSFKVSVCPVESDLEQHQYPGTITYKLNTDHADSFATLARTINACTDMKLVVVQHEFGFFAQNEEAFLQFLESVSKQVVLSLHTVLPFPNHELKLNVQRMSASACALIVMTHASKDVLVSHYQVPAEKITVIAHGTHLVPHLDQKELKTTYHLSGRKILSTFGLLSSGKSIETTLKALPAIVKRHPDVLFLIIGKTHPNVVKHEGEKYRQMLEATVGDLGMQAHVRFVNQFLPLPELLEYLQLTDIYLFTSKDPNQAVSGTFSYAIACGCPIVSTPIPHAREVLNGDAGVLFDFENSKQLAAAVNDLLDHEQARAEMGSNALHKMASTAWQNAAISHALLLKDLCCPEQALEYKIPPVNLAHLKKMTTHFGIVQFSKTNHPDIRSGYTLDDNARALVALCQQFDLEPSPEHVSYIRLYFDFIKGCLQPGGIFLNYLDEMEAFTIQNSETNLEDSTGRAIWALGFLISVRDKLPAQLVAEAQSTLQAALVNVGRIHSPRAMAFIIKGLYYRHRMDKFAQDVLVIEEFASRLVQMYRHEADGTWLWYEGSLTYGNSILPEAMLCAWLVTGKSAFKEIAKESFDFLLSKTFAETGIRVVSNKTWLHRINETAPKAVGGEQPIDIAYTILALEKFYEVFRDEAYRRKMDTAFSWFLGNNHLHQIIYNPCTGGCYDGLEEHNVNLNQGAESTVSYLMARLTIGKMERTEKQKQARGIRKEESALRATSGL